MTLVVDSQQYLQRLLDRPAVGLDKYLAFYDHSVGAVCTDPRCMLLPMDDHLVHRADGVFEALKYVGGKLYQLDAHLARMQRSRCCWAVGRAVLALTPPNAQRQACTSPRTPFSPGPRRSSTRA